MRGRGALVVVMNRDERHDRPAARPPRRWPGAGGGFTAPVDGGAGGSWIAVRDSGVVLALLNHRPRRGSGSRPPVPATLRRSRGHLVTALAAEATVPDAARVRACGLAAFEPFRLLVVGPTVPPRVFTWTGAVLTARRLRPRLGFITSSSWRPESVIPARHARFRARWRDDLPTSTDLVAFHDGAQHARGSAYAVRMSREDARTVSRTVVEVRGGQVSMDYRAFGEPRQSAAVPRVDGSRVVELRRSDQRRQATRRWRAQARRGAAGPP